MSTIKEVIREAAIAVSLGAGFELIAGGLISAEAVVIWLLVNRGML